MQYLLAIIAAVSFLGVTYIGTRYYLLRARPGLKMPPPIGDGIARQQYDRLASQRDMWAPSVLVVPDTAAVIFKSPGGLQVFVEGVTVTVAIGDPLTGVFHATRVLHRDHAHELGMTLVQYAIYPARADGGPEILPRSPRVKFP